MDRIVDFDAVNHGAYWTFEPLTDKARDLIANALPDWPLDHGLKLVTEGDADLGIALVRHMLNYGLTVDLDGRPCTLTLQ